MLGRELDSFVICLSLHFAVFVLEFKCPADYSPPCKCRSINVERESF
jgi:hypothetical protein